MTKKSPEHFDSEIRAMEIADMDRTAVIDRCADILTLLNAVKDMVAIPGGEQIINAEDEVAVIIEVFYSRTKPLSAVTRTYGIRNKLRELMGFREEG